MMAHRILPAVSAGLALAVVGPFIAGQIEGRLFPVYTDQHIQLPFKTVHPTYDDSICWYWRTDKRWAREFLSAVATVEANGAKLTSVPWSWRTGQSFRQANQIMRQDDYQRVVCVPFEGPYTGTIKVHVHFQYRGMIPWSVVHDKTPVVVLNEPYFEREYIPPKR